MLRTFSLLSALTLFVAQDALAQNTAPANGEQLSVEEEPYAYIEEIDEPPERTLQRFRKSFFQGFRLSGGWIGSGAENDLNISHLSTSTSFAVPLGSFDHLLILTPNFRVDFLDGPTQVDAPPQLYQAGVKLFWRKKLHDRWGVSVLLNPAVRSDFDTTEDTVRIFALALASWQWVPDKLKLSFGVVYLDRDDIPILPAIGLLWTPTPDWRFDLLFPRPKASYRLFQNSYHSETWCYVGGGLGGNTWAVRRASGASDELTLRDFRVALGLERLVDGGSSSFIEAGFVFGRTLEYQSSNQQFDFNDAFLIRGGFTY